MSKIIVGKLMLSDHPVNPNLQVGVINGHKVVVGRHYDEGILGFFIPDGCRLSDKIAEEMWLKGRLAGSKKDRVKAKDMQGVFSQGLFYGSRYFTIMNSDRVYQDSPSWNPVWSDGQDITNDLISDIFWS